MKLKKLYKKYSKKKIPIAVIGGTLCIIVGSACAYLIQSEKEFGLNTWEAYQNAANPTIRIVKIAPGMRKEEVATRFAKTLGWSDQDRKDLIKSQTLLAMGSSEGSFYPSTYVVGVHATPEDVSKEIYDTFTKQVVQNELDKDKSDKDLETVLKIASIIQRETNNKDDMKIISGIIWNRLAKNMTLDMDATLQYAKGTSADWWPPVYPEDKNINSPYNTYKNKGLPPSPISNPSLSAIDAAINPATTKALFYMHDAHGNIHTAITYTEHVANIAAYY